MSDKYICISATTGNFHFLLKNVDATYDFFRRAVETHNYIFSPELLKLKAASLRSNQAEQHEVYQIASDGLNGLVKRVSMKKFINDEVDDLMVLYFPANNSFVLKEISGETSASFDLFSLY